MPVCPTVACASRPPTPTRPRLARCSALSPWSAGDGILGPAFLPMVLEPLRTLGSALGCRPAGLAPDLDRHQDRLHPGAAPAGCGLPDFLGAQGPRLDACAHRPQP